MPDSSWQGISKNEFQMWYWEWQCSQFIAFTILLRYIFCSLWFIFLNTPLWVSLFWKWEYNCAEPAHFSPGYCELELFFLTLVDTLQHIGRVWLLPNEKKSPFPSQCITAQPHPEPPIQALHFIYGSLPVMFSVFPKVGYWLPMWDDESMRPM